jgi:hydrogenase nickel incorporation protein HypA/HybF
MRLMPVALRLEAAAVRLAGAAAGARKVRKLALRVGQLSGVVPEALRFAFDVVARGTVVEGAGLVIENIPAACWCATCAQEFESRDWLAECPRCQNVSGDLRRGRELEIAAVELE